MRRLFLILGLLLTVATAATQAQTVTVAGDRFELGSAPCTFTSGSGAPSGGSTCDTYMDTSTGDLYTKLSGGWEKLPRFSEAGTWTAAQAFNAGVTGTTASFSSTGHFGGNFDVATTMATIAAATGNTSIAGTLHAGGDFDVATSKFTVAASSGNTSVGGALHAVGDFDVNTSKFTVAASSGNTAVAGTLNVTGATTLSSTLGVTGAATHSSTLDQVGTETVHADVMPNAGYVSNLGSLSDKYLTLHAAELWVETLVAQSTMATIGGRVLVAPTNELTADVAPTDAGINVKYNNLAVNDIVYLEANGKVEFIKILSGPIGTGPYIYGINGGRDLDGTGANQWYAGDAIIDTGQAGSGFIDLYSISGVKSTSEAGPSIVGNVRQSSTYNDWAPRWAIGNLKNLYGYAATTYGVAMGDPTATNITIDATNGIRIRNGTTDKLTADTSGNLSVVGDLSVGTSGDFRSGATAIHTGVGWWMDYNGGSPRFRIGDPAGDEFYWDGSNLVIGNGLKLCSDAGCTLTATLSAIVARGVGFGGLSTDRIGATTWMITPELDLSGTSGVLKVTDSGPLNYLTAIDRVTYNTNKTMLRLANGVDAAEVATSLLVGNGGTTAPAATLEVNGTSQFDGLTSVGGQRLNVSTPGLTVYGPAPSTGTTVATSNAGYGQLVIVSSDSAAQDDGGMLSFGGYYTGTSSRAGFSIIRGAKENTTAGDFKGYLSFLTQDGSTGLIERMRISSGGFVGIGMTSSKALGVTSATDGTVFLNNTSGVTTSTMVQFDFGGSAIASITCTSSACAYNTTSDRRVKKNLAPTKFGIADVMRLPIYDGQYVTDGTSGTFVVAQELATVFPEAVTQPADATATCDPRGDMTGCWQVDYGRLTPLLFAGEQDLQRELDRLTQRVAALEAALKGKGGAQ